MAILENYNFSIKDDEFQNLVNRPELKNEREIVESLWVKYERFADKQFKIELGKNFHQRYWEMYIGYVLMEKGFALQPRISNFGPDIHILEDNTNIWIEATAPRGGTGSDAVISRLLKPGEIEFINVPEEKIVLRYISSINEKNKKYQTYLNKGFIKSNEPFIIAINGRRIDYSILEDGEIPFIVKALFPFGNIYLSIDNVKNKIINEGYTHRPNITKNNKSQVSTQFFIDPISSGVSGILFSNSDLFNRPIFLGDEFIYIHNPCANNKLPLGWLKFGREFWVDNDHLCWRLIK